MRNMPQWQPTLRLTFLLTLALTPLVAFDSSAPRHSSAAAPEPLQTPSPTQSPTASPTPEKLSASPAEIVFTAADKDKSFTVKKSDQTEIVIDDNWECKPTDDIAICQKGNNNKFKITSQKNGVTTIKVTYKKEPQKYETLSVKVMIPYKDVAVSIAGAIRAFDSGSKTVSNIDIPEGETLNISVLNLGIANYTSPIALAENSATISSGANLLSPSVKDGILVLKAGQLGGGGQLAREAIRTASLSVEVPRVDNNPVTPATINLNVNITPKNFTLELVSTPVVLLKNGRAIINAVVKDRSLAQQPAFFTFSLDNSTDGRWVSLSQEANSGKATLTWREAAQSEVRKQGGGTEQRPSSVKINVSAQVGGNTAPLMASLDIPLREVNGFALLKVKLNVMDDRTAADLYGSVAAQEYFVLTVRLFNNLQASPDGEVLRGASILAYSSSIEVAVGLEKRFNGKARSSFGSVLTKSAADSIRSQQSDRLNADAMQKVKDNNDLRDKFNDAYKIQAAAEIKAVEATQKAYDLIVTWRSSRNDEDKRKANDAIAKANDAIEAARAAALATEAIREMIANSSARSRPNLSAFPSGPGVAIDDGMWHSMTRADTEGLAPLTVGEIADSVVPETGKIPFIGDDEATPPATDGIEYNSPVEPTCQGVIKYRPFTFEMMVNTVDRRNERRKRTKIFNVLEFIGTGTSFVTSFLVPGAGSDLPLGLEKYRNLFIPGMERIYRDYKELHRQNIVSQTMKEIEEIPYGSDITRVIFIPKKNIRGLMRGHDVRISEICPYYFNIEVGIIRDKATVQQQITGQ